MIRLLQAGVVAATLALTYVAVAFGQGVPDGPTLAAQAQTAAIDLNTLLAPWIPLIMPIIGGIIIALLEFIRQWAKARFGLILEESRMQQLQAALTNAAGLALTKVAQNTKSVTLDVGSPAVKQAVEYVNQSAAEAVTHFSLTPEQLAEKIIAKVGVITAPNPELSIKSDVAPPPRPGEGS